MSESNGEVHVIGAEIDEPVMGGDPHVDLRMDLVKTPQPGHEPLDREGLERVDAQRLVSGRDTQLVESAGHAVEELAGDLRELLAGRSQGHSPNRALEQLQAPEAFEGLDLVADRALSDVQLVRGPGEAHVTRGRLECPQRRDGRESSRHGFEESDGGAGIIEGGPLPLQTCVSRSGTSLSLAQPAGPTAAAVHSGYRSSTSIGLLAREMQTVRYSDCSSRLITRSR